MTVQLHLAHSANFVGAGIIAGGPYRCAESFRGGAVNTEDAYVMSSIYVCMSPLIPECGPNPEHLARVAQETAAAGGIDPLANLADDRLYIFTGSNDKVVSSSVVASTRKFYELLGVPAEAIRFVSDVPAGHSIITDNPVDSPLDANRPPFINYGGFTQSHDILTHIYGELNPPAEHPGGRIVRFDQREFFDGNPDANMSDYGFAYVPAAVDAGAPCRVHIALHGCLQGYNSRPFVNGKPDLNGAAPYGNRYYTSTGYNELADTNNLLILYPQVQGSDSSTSQNPEGCWDWWGYTARDVEHPDFYSKKAVQIQAIYRMLQRLGGQ
jgi:hypothetical protein